MPVVSPLANNRRFGWKPQLPDIHDRPFQVDLAHACATAPLPAAVDLRSICPAVYDQGQLGSCTANAIGGACEVDWIREKKASPFVPSRLFIYWNERNMEGTVDQDAGAVIRDGIKTLNVEGFCPESLWPDSDDTTGPNPPFVRKPPQAAFAAALKNQVRDYTYLPQSLTRIQRALFCKYPVVFGFTVYESFMTQEVADTGIMPIPQQGEQILGGHAVLMVGYDNNRQAFLVRNSWSAQWGLKGYFWFPYACALDPQQASDFWVVRMV